MEHGYIGEGIYQGGKRPIVIAMIQTLLRREPSALISFLRTFDVIFWDECHVVFRKLSDALIACGKPYIGLTATPLSRGMSSIYSRLVQVTTTNELIAKGRLAPCRFREGRPIEMGGPPPGAEWDPAEIRNRGRVVIGDIVSTWMEETNAHFGGPVKTMLFSADIAHGEELVAGFVKAGIDARQVTARDNREYRKSTMQAFLHGEFPVICSVAALGKGTDVPSLQCIIIARPLFRGFAAHLQMLGRGMRAAEGKEYVLCIDHAGNVAGFRAQTEAFWEVGTTELDDKRFLEVTRTPKEKEPKPCRNCGFPVPPSSDVCLVCGTPRVKPRTGVETIPGTMISIGDNGGKTIRIEPVRKGRAWVGDEKRLWVASCTHAATFLRRHRSEYRAYRQALATYRALAGEYPPRDFKFTPGKGVVPAVIRRRIDRNYRIWKKSQEKTESTK